MESTNAFQFSNMGVFSRLASELRNMIWAHFAVEERHECEKENTLDILRTCHQIHDEVLPFILGKKGVLKFHISPLYEYKSWLSVDSRRGEIFPSRDIIKEIKVQIEAPALEDPGQLICLLQKVEHFVDFLKKVDGLPMLDIQLRDSRRSRGRWGGICQESELEKKPAKKPQMTFWHGSESNGDRCRCYEDHKLVIELFSKLRGVSKASIGVEGLAGTFNTDKMEETRKFEERPEHKLILRRIERRYARLDEFLDTLQGQTASMLRLDRFSESGWYEYRDRMQRIVRLPSDAILDDIDMRMLTRRLDSQYVLMLAFNPLSAKMQVLRFQQYRLYNNGEDDEPLYPLSEKWNTAVWEEWRENMEGPEGRKRHVQGRLSLRDVVRVFELEDGWDPEEWHRYYRSGLPPLDLPGFKDLMGPIVRY